MDWRVYDAIVKDQVAKAKENKEHAHQAYRRACAAENAALTQEKIWETTLREHYMKLGDEGNG